MAGKTKTIHEKLTEIQVGFKAQKSRYNSFGKYYYRSAEDILEASKPFLKDLKCSLKIDEQLLDADKLIILSTATLTCNETKDTLSAQALVAVDLQAKGMQMPQRFGAASSYGKKYALGNLLLIDDTADADATNTHGKSVTATTAAAGTTKQKITKNSEQGKKAIAHMKNGGKLEQITAFYDITDAFKKELQNIKPDA